MGSRSSKRTRLKPEVRRAQLLDVGLEVFAREGLDATSLDEVAAEANVTRPIVYHYFENKQAFFDAIAEREMELIIERFSHFDPQGSLRVMIENAAALFFEYLDERPAGFAALVSHAPIGWYGEDRVSELRRDLYSMVVTFIAGIGKREADLTVDPGLIGLTAIGAFVFAGEYWLAEGQETPAPQAAKALAATVWRGVGSQMRSPKPRQKRGR